MNIISLINKVPFGNSAEKGFFLYTRLPAGLFQKMEEENFRKTVRFVAAHSTFYRRKFKELGIEASRVRTPKDLGDFFTTAEDIRQTPDDFVCLPADTAFETTGTTSKKPKRVYFSRNEIEELIRRSGGNACSSVSKNTDYVVAGKDPGSKFEKAKQIGVKIINEDEFKKLIL